MKLRRAILAMLIIGLIISFRMISVTTINAEDVQPFAGINDIVFGNGYFLGVGEDGYVVKSIDGKTWDIISEGMTGRSYSSIIYGNGQFLALSNNQEYYISMDGVCWTPCMKPANCGTIKYVNGKFFTFGSTSVFNTSTSLADYTNYLYESLDGIYWTPISVPGVPIVGSAGITDIAYGLGNYVLSTNQATYYVSADLASWSTKQIPDMYNWNWIGINSVSFQNDRFVSCLSNGDILYSTNPAGIWSMLSNTYANGSVYLNGNHIVYTGDSIYSTSASFPTWASWNHAQPPIDNVYSWYGFIDVAYGNNIYITTDGVYIDYSVDLLNWTRVMGTQVPQSKPTISTITVPDAVSVGDKLSLTVPTVERNGSDITAQEWEISSNGVDGWSTFNIDSTMASSDSGKYLRYYATNNIGTTYSNSVLITVNKKSVAINEAQQEYTYDGTGKTFTISGTPSSGYTITYLQSGNAVTPVLAGTYDVQITRVSDDTYNPYSKTILGGLLINKAVPAEVTFPTVEGITYGQALSDAALSGGSVEGTFAWTDGAQIPNVSNSGYEVTFTPSDIANYDYSGVALTKTIAVPVGKRTLTMTDPIVAKNKVYDGTTCAYAQVGMITNKVGSDDVNVSIESVSFADAAVGTNKAITVIYSLSGSAVENYNAPENYVIKDGVIIALVPGTVVWNDKTVTYTGEAKTNTIDTLPAGVAGVTYTYSGETEAPINAGTYTVEATFTMQIGYAQLEPTTRTLNIEKAVPAAVTFPTASGITYGQALSDVVLSEGSGDGTFAWTDGAQIPTVSNSGYEVTFTPSDALNYDYTGVALTKTIAVSVGKRTLTVTDPVVTKTKNYDGNTSAQVQVGTITNKVGTDDVNVSIESASYADAAVGTNKTITVIYSLSGGAVENYSTPENYVIKDGAINALVPGTVVWNHKTVTYTGKVQTNTIDTLPAGVTGVTYTYDGRTEVPINAGTYTVEATFTMDTGYTQLEAVTRTLKIEKAVPAAVTFPTASGITYGQALSDAVLSGGSGDGTFAWADGAQIPTVSNSGYKVTFTPSDTTNYDYTGVALTKTIAVSVGKKTLTVTDPIVTKTKNYDGNTGAQVQVGTITNKVGTDDVKITVESASYGDAGVGTDKTITIIYSITGGAAQNYNAPENYVIKGGVINALVPGTVVWNHKTVTYTGKVQTNTIDTLPAGVTRVTYTYDGRTEAPINAGTYTVEATFTMEPGYTQLEAVTRTLKIEKAVPAAITFPTAVGITYGQTLSDSVLSGGSVDGTFTWTDGGVIPTVSNSGYEVTFTPSDIANYDYTGVALTKIITVSVGKRTLIVTDPVVVKEKDYDGGIIAEASAGTIVNKVDTDDVNVSIKSAEYDNENVGIGKTITINYEITGKDAENYKIPGSFVISDGVINPLKTGELAWTDKNAIYNGNKITNTVSVMPEGVSNITYTYNGSSEAPVNAGTYTVNAVFLMEKGYEQLDSATRILTIEKAKPSQVVFPSASELEYGSLLSESSLTGESGDGEFKWANGSIIPTVVNDGYEMVFTPRDIENYDYSDVALTETIAVKILPRTAELVWSGNGERVYDGTESNISATVNNLVGDDNCTIEVTGGKEKKAGTYTAKAVTISNNNYCLPSDIDMQYIIRKAFIKITADAKEKTVGQSDPELTYTQSGLLTGDVLQGALVRETGENAGLYAIKSNLSNTNYNIQYVGNYLKISSSSLEQVNPPIGTISGKVFDNTNINLPITVSLYIGDKPLYSLVLADKNEYQFSGLKNGVYNIVADNGQYRVTEYVQITNQESVRNVNLQFTRMQSEIEVIENSDQESNVADLVVDGLNNIYNSDANFTSEDRDLVNKQGGSIVVKLIAEDKQEKDIQIAAEAIKTIATNKNVDIYFDISVIKTALTDAGDELYSQYLSVLDNTIKIIIPMPDSLRGKSGIVLYRIHDGVAEALPIYNGSGEGFSYDTDYIYIYTKKFSTYAIGYDSSIVSNNIETSNTNQENLVAEAVNKDINKADTTTALVKATPETGDTTSIRMIWILFILSGTGFLILNKKKVSRS